MVSAMPTGLDNVCCNRLRSLARVENWQSVVQWVRSALWAVRVAGEALKRRDGMGVEDAASIDISALEDSQLLAIEVPMR